MQTNAQVLKHNVLYLQYICVFLLLKDKDDNKQISAAWLLNAKML